jgi:hypothetical protein
MWDNVIAIAIIAAVVGLAAAYIIKAKKAGKKCIGCPYADSCGKRCNCKCESDKQ